MGHPDQADVLDRTIKLIIERFNVAQDYAQRLAQGALNGIEAHGGDSTDWECIDKTVSVVVKSWVESGIDFPDVS